MKKILLSLLIVSSLKGFSQSDTISLITYNLMYYRASSSPCTHNRPGAQRDADLKSLFNYLLPDIFVVNELGAGINNAPYVLSNIINTDGRTNYAQANYSNNNFSSITNMLFYNTDVLQLVSQTKLELDINNGNLVRAIDFYRLMYKDPLHGQGADTTHFTVVAIHFKAGDSSSDKADRAAAAEGVMRYLEMLVPDDNVILCGDLNLYTSNEAAYNQLLNYSKVSERFYDPINRPGNWNNNASFADVHTQSTHSSGSGCFSGGGLDDRFDFILVSESVKDDSKGLGYITGSYRAFGNDGDHFNQSINNGFNSTAPAYIIDALYNFSDHLPVEAKFRVDKYANSTISEVKSKLEVNYNNPAEQLLKLQFNGAAASALKSVRLVDLTGKTVYTEQSYSKNIEIKISGFSKGIYLLKITGSANETITRKVILR